MKYAYEDLLAHIYYRGEDRTDRTGTGTRSIFGTQIEFDLAGNTLPLITTKKLHVKSIIHELLWMLSGSTDVKELQAHGVTIWDEWADEAGQLGPVYGAQWRGWETPAHHSFMDIDQIGGVIRLLRSNPDTRRAVVSAWNVADIDRMKLPPCHMIFQFHISSGGALSCHMNMRSADAFLGLPFNIASYAILTMMVAKVLKVPPGRLIISLGDVHIYKNHFDQVTLQLQREPREFPKLKINYDGDDIDGIAYEDFEVIGYNPHPAISAPVAV